MRLLWRLRCSFSAPNRRDVMQCDLATLLHSYFGYVELVQALEADSSFPPPPLSQPVPVGTCTCMYVLLRYVASFPLPAAVLPHSVFPYSPFPPSPVSGSSSGPGLSGYIGADKLNQVYTWEYLALGGIHWPRKQALQQADVVMPVRKRA